MIYFLLGIRTNLFMLCNGIPNTIIKLFKCRNSIAQLLLSKHYHYYYLLWLEEHYLFAYFACGPQSWFSAQSLILTRFLPITIIITSKHQLFYSNFLTKSLYFVYPEELWKEMSLSDSKCHWTRFFENAALCKSTESRHKKVP